MHKHKYIFILPFSLQKLSVCMYNIAYAYMYVFRTFKQWRSCFPLEAFPPYFSKMSYVKLWKLRSKISFIRVWISTFHSVLFASPFILFIFFLLSLSLSLVLFISMYLSGVFSLSPPFWTECVTNLFPIYLCHVSSNLLFWIIYAWNFVLLKASSLYYVFTIGLCAFLVLSTTTCAAKPMVTFCTNRSKCKARDVLHH